MASNTVLASNFNTNKISFSQVKTLDFGGKQAYINYDGQMFVMQTPSCALPYGMIANDKFGGPVKYNIELSLRGYDEPGKMKQFYEALTTLDEFMIDQGVKNSQQWFKASLSREVIAKLAYKPMIRWSKDKDGNPKPYPPTIRLALKKKRDSDDFDLKVVDAKRQDYKGIPLEELLVKGAAVTCLMQATGVWISGSTFGVSWKAVYARVDSLPRSAGAFDIVDDGETFGSAAAPAPAPAMVDDEEEDEEEQEEAPVPAKKSVLAAVMPAPAPAPAPTIDDEADDAEPVPVPKKAVTTVVKKKVVTKKA